MLDASAVVRIIEGSPQAAAFQQAVLESELVLAPELMLTKTSNALWRLQRAGQLQPEGLQQFLSRAAALMDQIEPDRHLQVDAYIIGPADVLDLKLFDAEELSGALEVLNDGSVPLPLVGSGQYLGDRYHHHPAAERIFLPGGDCGSVLQKRAQLEAQGQP